jgi:hypothetical protein
MYKEFEHWVGTANLKFSGAVFFYRSQLLKLALHYMFSKQSFIKILETANFYEQKYCIKISAQNF